MNHLPHTNNAMRPRHARLTALAIVALIAGCGNSADDSSGPPPAAVFEKMRTLHQQRRYRQLESLIEPPSAGKLIDTLMAVDRLLDASNRLRDLADKKLGPAAAVHCNLGVLADFLGPFSRKIDVISVRVDGDKARVTFQSAQRVPVERAEFTKVSGQWKYAPDQGRADLPKVLLDLSERLNALRAAVDAGQLNIQEFINEYQTQVLEPLQTYMASE